MYKIKRNEPCPCESGKKWKKCCMSRFGRYFKRNYGDAYYKYMVKIMKESKDVDNKEG